MNDTKTIKDNLIAVGHDPALVEQTEQTAMSLRKLLDETPSPSADDLKTVFEDSIEND